MKTAATPKVWLLVLLVMFLSSACSRPKTVLTSQQRNEVEKSILTAIPANTDLVEVGAVFGNKIRLLGYSISSPNLLPSAPSVLTWYWEYLEELPGNYKIFVHLDGSRRHTLDHHAVSGLLPVSAWKPGQIIRDSQTVSLPARFPPGMATLWVGFFDEAAWKNAQKDIRLPITEVGSGRKDPANRLAVGTIKIGDQPEKTARVLPAGKITIDGLLDEPQWQEALREIGAFVEERTGKPLPPGQDVKAGFLWDDEYLYLGWQVTDIDIRSPYTKRDSTLWSDGKKGRMDVLELFLAFTDGQPDRYIELQISPANVIFDALFTGHRKPAWKEAAASLDMALEHAVFINGTLNDPSPDTSYSAEIRIPFSQLPGIQGPPKPQTRWRANLFRLSNGPEVPAAWNPAGGDYHNLMAGGILEFSH